MFTINVPPFDDTTEAEFLLSLLSSESGILNDKATKDAAHDIASSMGGNPIGLAYVARYGSMLQHSLSEICVQISPETWWQSKDDLQESRLVSLIQEQLP